MVSSSSPFGGQTRTSALIALSLLGEGYPRQLSRLLSKRLYGVQEALAGLEKDGLVAGRSAGRTRLYQLNPRYFALTELRAYLGRLAEPETELRNRIDSLRRRPRRTGKRL
jgi:DNA-binding PadR family transcriptional regulator